MPHLGTSTVVVGPGLKDGSGPTMRHIISLGKMTPKSGLPIHHTKNLLLGKSKVNASQRMTTEATRSSCMGQKRCSPGTLADSKGKTVELFLKQLSFAPNNNQQFSNLLSSAPSAQNVHLQQSNWTPPWEVVSRSNQTQLRPKEKRSPPFASNLCI